MSSISCPYCLHVMELKGAKPGRFQPACPACKAKFLLTIPSDLTLTPVVGELLSRLEGGETRVALSDATVPPPSETVAQLRSNGGAATVPPPSPQNKPSDRKSIYRSSSNDVTAVPRDQSDEMEQSLTRPPGPPMSPGDLPPMLEKLGGYQLVKKLGQGGMGAVYLAKQTSLDRNVALKVLSPRLAADPHFVSRFTREAFAAAQLSHHNVVQIHDIGVEQTGNTDTNYFSMEFVEGKTLAGVVRETGKLDPDAAVGYILQAARGLKFAHDHGLIHRDVKPDNLLLNEHGVLKVADLGLVKRTGVAETVLTQPGLNSSKDADVSSGQTQTSVAMGTPAYMPPEQARDAAAVDPRADVYSLGCTLYDLLTGHPPFTGKTAAELMTKHAKEPVVPPDRLAKEVPGELSKIVMKMVAKKPDDRYPNMAAVIVALEKWLGVESGKAFSPQKELVTVLESAAEQFNQSSWAKIRKYTIRGFYGAAIAAIIIAEMAASDHPLLPIGILGFVLSATVVYHLTYGLVRRTFFISKLRQLAFSSSLSDWLHYLMIVALTLPLLIVFDIYGILLGVILAGAAAALLFFFLVDVALAKDREPSLIQAERMIKDMRLHGLDENSVRQFVCKYSGRHWEEFYEALFGYEAKLQARQAWGRGERARNRPRYAAWREPIIHWIDAKTEIRKELRQQKMLAKLETAALRAKGMDLLEANRVARKNAQRLIDKGAAIREAAYLKSAETALPSGGYTGGGGAAIAQNWMHDDSPAPRGHTRSGRHESYVRRRYGSPLQVLTGRGIRFMAAMLILAGFAFWWKSNGAIDVQRSVANLYGEREDVTLTVASKEIVQGIKTQRGYQIGATSREPLHLKAVPDWLCDGMGRWGGGVAGGLLLLSLFFSGSALGITVLLAAAVGMFGHLAPIAYVAEHDWVPSAAAAVLWLMGVVLFRQPHEG